MFSSFFVGVLGVAITVMAIAAAVVTSFFCFTRAGTWPFWKLCDVEDPSLQDYEALLLRLLSVSLACLPITAVTTLMHDKHDSVNSSCLKLRNDSGHGVVHPSTNSRVPRLLYGEVVSPSGEEGVGWIERAVVQEGVDGEGEEGGEVGE
jgi:hypothetical protein